MVKRMERKKGLCAKNGGKEVQTTVCVQRNERVKKGRKKRAEKKRRKKGKKKCKNGREGKKSETKGAKKWW